MISQSLIIVLWANPTFERLSHMTCTDPNSAKNHLTSKVVQLNNLSYYTPICTGCFSRHLIIYWRHARYNFPCNFPHILCNRSRSGPRSRRSKAVQEIQDFAGPRTGPGPDFLHLPGHWTGLHRSASGPVQWSSPVSGQVRPWTMGIIYSVFFFCMKLQKNRCVSSTKPGICPYNAYTHNIMMYCAYRMS